MTCVKAQGFLETNAVPPAQTIVDARKERYDRTAALKLARAARRVIVARGKKVLVYDMKRDAPDDDTLAAALLGPTGNLKAPTVRVGETLLVGFNDEAYRELLD
jgi:arsenate reductase-like glutaredoxin family protein